MKNVTPVFIENTLKVGSPEWHKARKDYITASEIGACMGLNPYMCAAELFHRKLGLMPDGDGLENQYTYWGHQLEQVIASAWECHNGENDSYLLGVKHRKAKDVGGFYTCKELPFLAATPDKMADKSGFKTYIDDDGNMQNEPLTQDFPLELKTISKYAKDTWESGIPVYYLCQVHAQMLVTNTDYCELVLLVDGRQLEIYPIHRSEELVDMIIAKCTEFWNKLQEAKELLKDGVTDEVMKEISKLEPPAEGTESYADFLKKKFNIEDKSRVATNDEVLIMKNYIRANELEKQAVASKLDLKNKLLASSEDFMQLTSEEVTMVNKPKSETQARAYFSIKLNKKK